MKKGKPVRDLVGQEFGRLRVLNQAGRDKHGRCLWGCTCICGKSVVVKSQSLIRGSTTSCGCYRKEVLIRVHRKMVLDLTGQRFGRLLVTSYTAEKEGRGIWLCLCDCGNMTKVRRGALVNGTINSCGCFRKELNIGNTYSLKHGHDTRRLVTPTYRSWAHMKSRCFDENNRVYSYYGGRGITVCERWLKFENFLEDMGERPEGKTIDRYPDVNGNYEPGNCRWATKKEQTANRRPVVAALG